MGRRLCISRSRSRECVCHDVVVVFICECMSLRSLAARSFSCSGADAPTPDFGSHRPRARTRDADRCGRSRLQGRDNVARSSRRPRLPLGKGIEPIEHTIDKVLRRRPPRSPSRARLALCPSARLSPIQSQTSTHLRLPFNIHHSTLLFHFNLTPSTPPYLRSLFTP